MSEQPDSYGADERISEIRNIHVVGVGKRADSCANCYVPWPCDAAYLLALVDSLTAENAALREERDALRAAATALTAKTPCFVTIRPGGDDIECCQFCLTNNGHAADCEWVALVAALAGPASGGEG